MREWIWAGLNSDVGRQASWYVSRSLSFAERRYARIEIIWIEQVSSLHAWSIEVYTDHKPPVAIRLDDPSKATGKAPKRLLHTLLKSKEYTNMFVYQAENEIPVAYALPPARIDDLVKDDVDITLTGFDPDRRGAVVQW